MLGRLAAAAAAAAFLALATHAGPASAQQAWTAWGSVRELEGGWTLNTASVLHSAPVANPGACPAAAAGYATDPAAAGANLFHTLLLSAFLNRVEVRLLIDGCVFQKPRIIAVALRNGG